jgi:acetyl-CoA C-acetyltransferase
MMTTNIGELREGVSIIGVGCTPFGSCLTTPEIKDMTERELFSWAALEAMEDAGIEAKDIDAFYIGHCMSETLSRTYASAAAVADWIGMRNKPGFRHESACSSANTGLQHAVLAVASGVYRIVLSGGVEIVNSRPRQGKPAHMREAMPEEELLYKTNYGADQAYWYPSGVALRGRSDLRATAYCKKYGLTWEQLEDASDAVAINNRRNGVRNTLATTYKKEFADEARERGFKDVKEYMKSRFNPYVGPITRAFHVGFHADGASALIVCPTKLARTFTDYPIGVIGFGSAVNIGYHLVGADSELEELVFAQAYKMAKIDPYKDIDYMHAHDVAASHQFMTAETAGYFRPLEGWRAVMEGRTAFDGDKPISTSGGRTAMGHAYAASAGAEIAEAVWQMRGLCGARQIKPIPEVSVVHSSGHGMYASVSVLRTHS